MIVRRRQQQNAFLVNEGAANPGHFVNVSDMLPQVSNTSSAVAACDLVPETSGPPLAEVVVGDGDVNDPIPQSDEVLRLDAAASVFNEVDVALGFGFTTSSGFAANVPEGGVTEEVECDDMDADGVVDVVALGNTGSQKTWLFFRK